MRQIDCVFCEHHLVLTFIGTGEHAVDIAGERLSTMKRSMILFIHLMLAWLLLSGHYSVQRSSCTVC